MISKFTLKNTTTREEISFGQDTSADFVFKDNGIDWGNVPAIHNLYSYPGQIGTYISSTTLNGRDVSIIGYAFYEFTDIELKKYSRKELLEVGYKKLLDKKQTLIRVINPNDYIQVLIGDYYIEGKPSRSVVFGSTGQDNNEYFCRFQINLYCNNPMFLKQSIVQAHLGGVKPKFHFPLIFPKDKGIIMGVQSSYQLIEVENTGEATVGCTISLTARGEVESPRIENIITREVIQVDKTMHSGEKIVIITDEGRNKSIKGYVQGREYNYFKYWNFNNSWMKFPVGTSRISYSTGNKSEGLLDITLSINPVRYGLEEL